MVGEPVFNSERFSDEEDRDFEEELQENVDDCLVFEHRTFSALTGEKAQNFLENNDIETLYICGLETDGIIIDTGFHAFNIGLEVKMIENLSDSASGREYHETAKKIWHKRIGETVKSQNI